MPIFQTENKGMTNEQKRQKLSQKGEKWLRKKRFESLLFQVRRATGDNGRKNFLQCCTEEGSGITWMGPRKSRLRRQMTIKSWTLPHTMIFCCQCQFAHCDGCTLGNIRKRNMSIEKVKNAARVSECLFLHISSIKCPSMGSAKSLCLMMDDHSGFSIRVYLKRKLGQQEKGI